MIIRIFAFLGLAVTLSACAKVQVAKEKVYATPKAGMAIVYFYREKHFQGWALSYNVWDNEAKPEKLGSLKNGSYFVTYVKPGTHKFFINGETQGATSIEVKAGKTYYVQSRIDMGVWSGRPKLTEVTENEGEKQIKSDELVMTTFVPEDKPPAK